MSRKRHNSKPVPVMIPEDMRKQIRTLADKSRLSDAAIMRMAIDRGLGAVRRMFEEAEKQAA